MCAGTSSLYGNNYVNIMTESAACECNLILIDIQKRADNQANKSWCSSLQL